jgi:hypothetical protein
MSRWCFWKPWKKAMARRWFLNVTMGALVLGGLFVTGWSCVDATAVSQGISSDVLNVTQGQDKGVSATQRFVVLPAFTNDAVLDKETGLVWERSPQTTSAIWTVANRTCNEKNVGGRKGWRLPSLQELTSLVDPSVVPPALALPAGHPFLAIRSAVYWSSTRVGEDPKGSWGVHFGLGGGATFIHWSHPGQVWCVRDGMNEDHH